MGFRLRVRVQSVGCRVRVWGVGFRIWGFRVWGFRVLECRDGGFRVFGYWLQALECRVKGLGV